jgi:Tetratricopeptide repeat
VISQPVSLAPRPALLAGREQLLGEMDAVLSADDRPWPRSVVLSGMAGAGKTTVAVEYAHRHLAEVGVAWQFAAEDREVLAAGFSELAAQLGARELFDARDPVASVHAVLAAYPAGWILVFDNAPDWASVQTFLPPAGRGRVVVTSQSSLWPSGPVLEVPVLDTKVAAGFLVSRTSDPDREAARDLASELGGLPLALEQAAAFIHATGNSLAGYLALFRQRRAALLSRGEVAGYGKTVAATWGLAFSRLDHADPAAAGLLRLLACCAPEAIPLPLLLQSGPALATQPARTAALLLTLPVNDPLALSDAIIALRRYSLVTPAGAGLVSVHRLVQAVTLDQIPAELADAWRQATAALIEAAIPGDTFDPGSWPVCAAVLPHAIAALAADSDGLERIADYLGSRGSYAAARDLQQRIYDAREHELGPEDPRALMASVRLINWIGEAGDTAGARDRYALLIPVYERVIGAEHPGSLTARNNHARWTGKAGNAAGARDQLADLLPVRERVLGPEHPDTIATRANLARWAGETGDAAGARDEYAALLPLRERILGPEHPDTMTARHNFARWTGQAGNAAGARDEHAVLLPVRERVLGPEHPDTLTTRASLAYWTGQAGDAAEARDLYAALLPVRQHVSGPDHPDTLSDQANLAYWSGQAGDAAGARDQYAALLPVRQYVSGPDHPATLTARASLADWSRKADAPAGPPPLSPDRRSGATT